jgi:hypothetical protein
VVETIDFPADEMVVNVLPPTTPSAAGLLPVQTTTAAAAGIAATMPLYPLHQMIRPCHSYPTG